MSGGVHGRGGVCMADGVCMPGGLHAGVYAGETATEVVSTHHTGMHSCYTSFRAKSLRFGCGEVNKRNIAFLWAAPYATLISPTNLSLQNFIKAKSYLLDTV